MGRRITSASETKIGLLRSVGPGLSPGCFSSPAGAMLLRLVPERPLSPAMLSRASIFDRLSLTRKAEKSPGSRSYGRRQYASGHVRPQFVRREHWLIAAV